MQISQPSIDTFNCLLDVTDAYRLAKMKDFDDFLRSAADLASRYKIGAEVGCFILHRHDKLNEGEVMARSERTNDQNQSGIVTRPENFKSLVDPVPVSFRFSTAAEGTFGIIPLEYSNSEHYARAARRILEQEGFLNEFAQLIYTHEMEEIVGLTLVSAAEMRDPTWTYVEEFALHDGVRENIVYPCQTVGYPEEDLIPTTWRLNATNDPDKTRTDPNRWNPSKGQPKPEYVCFKVCVKYSPGHAIEHRECANWV